ncbi:hypothetical protein D0865_02898 [Hortaea werneckii]|uniref:Tyrosine specific protein phosphatases domain-containing protein n=1 Tax=Hortaea werneckii TaxID=91943 RepID=A0A3M7D104_HORWE|nr:hypothetical protein D0865_02898 [Hortaea werneckii]
MPAAKTDTAADGIHPSTPPFDRILNFRDVGAHINQTADQNYLQTGKLYRSARPDGATTRDRDRLVNHYNIKTILDLRTETEHIESRRKHADSVPAAPAAAPSDPLLPLRIPEIDYVDIDFNGSGYTSALIRQLTWTQTARLLGLYAFGYRKEAIGVLSDAVMAERGLAGLAVDSLEHCQAEVKAVYDVLANEHSYPLVIHCTQGKDRTGLNILLVLMLLGVPIDAINEDYMLSEKELAPEKEEKVQEIMSIGLPASFADCPASWVGRVTEALNERHGGIEQYLESCGVSMAQQGRAAQLRSPLPSAK